MPADQRMTTCIPSIIPTFRLSLYAVTFMVGGVVISSEPLLDPTTKGLKIARRRRGGGPGGGAYFVLYNRVFLTRETRNEC